MATIPAKFEEKYNWVISLAPSHFFQLDIWLFCESGENFEVLFLFRNRWYRVYRTHPKIVNHNGNFLDKKCYFFFSIVFLTIVLFEHVKRTWGDREGNWGCWLWYVIVTKVIFSFRKFKQIYPRSMKHIHSGKLYLFKEICSFKENIFVQVRGHMFIQENYIYWTLLHSRNSRNIYSKIVPCHFMIIISFTITISWIKYSYKFLRLKDEEVVDMTEGSVL